MLLGDNAMTVEVVLYACQHCAGQGTCKNGVNGKTCVICAKRAECDKDIPKYYGIKRKEHFESFSGLVCSCCRGIGKTDVMTARMNNRITVALASVLPFILLGMTCISSVNMLFNEKLFYTLSTLTCSVTGTIIGYYFSTKK